MQVYAFVDHSNINITAQKAAGRKLLFPEGIDDPCLRLVPAKTFDFLQNFHASNGSHPAQLAELFWYTSDQTVLQQENIGGRKVTGRCFKKGTWTTREKCVDTYFVADAVEVIFEKAQNLPECECPGILSLWTGDKDILQPIIDKARRNNWKIEIWSFDNSRSAVAGSAGESNEDIVSRSLDTEYENVVERRTGWKPNAEKRPPADSSMRLTFPLGSEELSLVRDKGWRDLVEHATRRACVPLQHWFAWDQGILYLILAVPPKEAAKHMRTLWEKRLEIQASIHTFIELQLKVRSACSLSMDQPPEKGQNQKNQKGPQGYFHNQGPGHFQGQSGSGQFHSQGPSHGHGHGGQGGHFQGPNYGPGGQGQNYFHPQQKGNNAKQVRGRGGKQWQQRNQQPQPQPVVEPIEPPTGSLIDL